MMAAEASPGEHRLVLKYAGVSLIGFLTDAVLLHLGVALGLQPAWARLISLSVAMQVTFTINGLHVFRCLALTSLPRQWVSYMVTNAFGNFCNYWIFVSLVSTHWPVVSNHLFALAVGSLAAWVANYTSTRYLVFRKGNSPKGAGLGA
jgi:putative flippase GtrA